MSTQTNIIERHWPLHKTPRVLIPNIRLLAAVFSRDLKIQGRDGNENVA